MKQETKRVEIPPRASVMIESMRDIGYSLQTAVADLIDNSITAGARNIELLADTTSPEPAIGIRCRLQSHYYYSGNPKQTPQPNAVTN